MILIIGAGPAGIGAAYASDLNGSQYVVLEKNSHHGGHCSSTKFGKSYIDEGPHISFTKYPNVRKLLHEFADNNVRKDQAVVFNYYEGKWITHPIMANLGQIEQHSVQLLESYLSASTLEKKSPKNYEEWLKSTYGEVATNLLYRPYTIKYWATDPSDMSVDWVQGRFFPPNPEVVKKGMTHFNHNAHYVQDFYYPVEGGFASFFKPKDYSNYIFEADVVTINPYDKFVITRSNKIFRFSKLISTMPLPELIRYLGNHVPEEVTKATDKLRCTSLFLVNIKVSKYIGPRVHWFYLYDLHMVSTRITIQTAILSGLDHLSADVDIQVEIYDRPGLNLSTDLQSRVIAEMIKIGLFEASNVITSSQKFVQYANVIFDHNRKDSLETINNYLVSVEIKAVGRYGSWDYLWSDESFLEGVGAVNPSLADELRMTEV